MTLNFSLFFSVAKQPEGISPHPPTSTVHTEKETVTMYTTAHQRRESNLQLKDGILRPKFRALLTYDALALRFILHE